MTNEEFIKSTARTDNFSIPSNLRTLCYTQTIPHILHCALGLSGEVGEISDNLIKHIVYNKQLDVTNLKEELGDCLWFIAKMLRTIDSSFEEVMDMNVRKLKVRYPDSFTTKDALNRNLDKENEALVK